MRIDQFRPNLKDMQSSGMINWIHPDYLDPEQNISQYNIIIAKLFNIKLIHLLVKIINNEDFEFF